MITDVGEWLRYNEHRSIIWREKSEICNNETKRIIKCRMSQHSGAVDRVVDGVNVFVCAVVTCQISIFHSAAEI